MSNLKIFTGNANPELARSVARHLDAAIGNVDVGTFSDGEVSVEIRENVRGSDCFVVQPTSQPANNHIMELLIMVDALRRSSARRITAVIPYYGYARQDRKVNSRVPITAKLVADLIVTAGTDPVLTLSRTTSTGSAASVNVVADADRAPSPEASIAVIRTP
ncbi:MAG: ribose-phosphate diphosphokinase [Myxococcales bacterium]|nr:ribose-phosphate diphosphokinase [Myxococcales bacterium]